MLKKRRSAVFHKKFCNLTHELIILQDLGFKESWSNRWDYVIRDDGHFTVSLIASGSSLYLKEEEMGNPANVVKLYDRNTNGFPMSKQMLSEQINILKFGLHERYKTSKKVYNGTEFIL